MSFGEYELICRYDTFSNREREKESKRKARNNDKIYVFLTVKNLFTQY